MDKKTRQSLIGKGFSTALIDKIACQNHTLSVLRAMPIAALRNVYSESEARDIADKVKRKPIPNTTLDAVVSKSGGSCCYCKDGNSSRPFQIHHITPHSESQDDSESNLMLICPTHHEVVPNRDTAEQQIATRDQWQSLVKLANDFKSSGIAFPFERLAVIDFHHTYKPEDLIHRYSVKPALAVALSDHALAEKCLELLRNEHFVVLCGNSGSGKTTLATGVAGLRSREIGAEHSFAFRGSREATAENLPLILQHLSCSKHNHVLIIDDANTFLSITDLETIANAAAKTRICVVATWTGLHGDGTTIQRHFPRAVSITWKLLQYSVLDFMLKNEVPIAEAIQSYRANEDRPKIGVGSNCKSLRSHLQQTNQNIKSVTGLLFLLRGAKDAIAQDLAVLADDDRSDIPVIFAAIEQIAGFEHAVSADEIASFCNDEFPSTRGTFTPDWIADVFAKQCDRGRMQTHRGLFTTIHREYARRLISVAMSDDLCRDSTERLLLRDFNCKTSNPKRLAILASWFYYDEALGPWLRNWTMRQSSGEWEIFIDRLCVMDLTTIGIVLDTLQTLSLDGAVNCELIASKIAFNISNLKSAIKSTNRENWSSLRNLAYSMATEKQRNDVISNSWEAAACASVLSNTHPTYYDDIAWFFNTMKGISPEWVTAVGSNLDLNQTLSQLTQVQKGDLKSIFEFRRVACHLGIPLRRSILKKIVTGLRNALSGAKISDLRLGFGEETLFLILFPQDYKYILSAIDSHAWARELEHSNPRDWRTLSTLLFMNQEAAILEKVHEAINPEQLAHNVICKYQGNEYDMRCFLWFLLLSSKAQRAWYLDRLREPIRDAFARNKSERPFLWKAVSQFDFSVANKLANEFNFTPDPGDVDRAGQDNWKQIVSSFTSIRQELQELDECNTDFILLTEQLFKEDSDGPYWKPV